MNTVTYKMRRAGKSMAAHEATEAALNAGKPVIVATPTSVTRQTRVGTLTKVEHVKQQIDLIIYDDL